MKTRRVTKPFKKKSKTKREFVVYCIRDVSTDIVYFGQTSDLKRREYEHNYLLKKGMKKPLYQYCREYNVTKIKLEPIKTFTSRITAKRYECYLVLDHIFNKPCDALYQKIPNISDR